MVSEIIKGDPGIASFTSEEHGQVDLWTGRPPSFVSTEPVGPSTTLALYDVVGFDINGDLVQAQYGGGEAQASGTLTFSGTGTAADTVTIGARVYTLQDTLAAIDDVLIGGTADATADNLVAAINAAGVEGTTYYTGTTKNLQVVASKGGSGIVEVQAIQPGQAGEIASTEAGTGASWGTATLLGGIGDGIQAIGVLAMKVLTGGGENIQADIWRDGTWNPAALGYHASYNDDTKKQKAFNGAPTPTSIVIRKNPFDSAFS